jgi:hypothetical protein
MTPYVPKKPYVPKPLDKYQSLHFRRVMAEKRRLEADLAAMEALANGMRHNPLAALIDDAKEAFLFYTMASSFTRHEQIEGRLTP